MSYSPSVVLSNVFLSKSALSSLLLCSISELASSLMSIKKFLRNLSVRLSIVNKLDVESYVLARGEIS